MTDDNSYFLDTNILISATDPDRADHQKATALLDRFVSGELKLLTSAQVLREYRVVCTRPIEVNGLGIAAELVSDTCRQFANLGTVLEEDNLVFQTHCSLCEEHHLTGKPVHDANIAATVIAHGYSKIYTRNIKDFAKYPSLELLPI